MQEGKDQPASSWYKDDEGSKVTKKVAETHPAKTDHEIQWIASEYIHHHKGALWFVGLAATALVAAALIYLLTRDKITVAIVLFCAIIFGISGARKPRVLPYRLDTKGLTIGQRFYPYGEYRAFAITDEGNFASITLVPSKRFGAPLNIYYPPDQERHIIDIIAEHLPMQPGSNSALDHLMRRIRF